MPRQLKRTLASLLALTQVLTPAFAATSYEFHKAQQGLVVVPDWERLPHAGLSTSALTFAPQVEHTTSAPLTVLVYNVDKVALNLGPLSVSGPFAATTDCGSSLAQGESCAVSVSFSPLGAGAAGGSLSLQTDDGVQTVALSGTGLAALAASLSSDPQTVQQPSGQFPDTAVYATQQATYFVKNTGQSGALAVNASLTSASQFQLVSAQKIRASEGGSYLGVPCGASGSTLALSGCVADDFGGQYPDIAVTVRFNPSSEGLKQATLSLAHNAANSPALSLPLSGLGVGTPAADVSATTMVWNTVTRPTAVGATVAGTVRLTNNGTTALALTAPVTMSGSTMFGATSNCGASLAVGAYCDATVSFSPTSTVVQNAVLQFSTNAGSPQVALTGTGLQANGVLAAASGSSTTFATVPVGSSTTRQLTFTNNGTYAASTVYATVAGAGLTFTANTCGTSASKVAVAVGGSCSMTVSWAPTTGGALTNASVTVTSNAVNSPSSIALNGTATAAVGALTPDTSADFGAVPVGLTMYRTFTFINSGDASAANTYAALSGTGLTLASNTCGVSASKVTVPALGSCSVTVAYAPSSVSTLTGSLTVYSSAVNGASVQALTGSGVTGNVASINFTGAVNTLVAQQTGTYLFEVSGAQGGNVSSYSQRAGGYGARLTCAVNLTAGQGLKVLVGGQGGGAAQYGGGGGGTYVTLADNTPLCIAGGGAGGRYTSGTTAVGLATVGGSGTGGAAGTGGTGGSGGGGGGLLTNGGEGAAHGGKAFINGGAGGVSDASCGNPTTAGGFGGGGAGGCGNWAGGSGGGYNGGASGMEGAGGTSYVAGTFLGGQSGAQSGNGRILVSMPGANALQAPGTVALAATAGSSTYFRTAVGSTVSNTFTLTNNSASASVFNIAATVTGNYLSVTGGSCLGTLAPSGSCTVTVQYAPTNVHSFSAGSLQVTSSASNSPVSLTLTGNTPGDLTAAAPTFEDVPQGATSSETPVVLTATNEAITVSSVVSSGSSEFVVTNASGCTAAAVAAGTSCTVYVTFTPSTLGARTGQLTVTSTGTSSPLTVPLTANSVVPSGRIVTVSPAVAGKSYYNLDTTTMVMSVAGDYTIKPLGNFSVTAKGWGGGAAAAGGYAGGTVALTSGQTLVARVGAYGGSGGTNTANSSKGPNGGGLAGLFTNSVSQANALLVAGGGGASAGGGAGAAGGTSGFAGGNSASCGGVTMYGGGGTQSAGGSAGSGVDSQYTNPTAGSALAGGTGGWVSSGSWGAGPGGGAGYYGGGGGAGGGSCKGGGGGGSSFVSASLSAASNLAASGATPGNSADADRGTGGNTGNTVGRLVLK